MLTGERRVLRADIMVDAGNSLSPAIDAGQVTPHAAAAADQQACPLLPTELVLSCPSSLSLVAYSACPLLPTKLVLSCPSSMSLVAYSTCPLLPTKLVLSCPSSLSLVAYSTCPLLPTKLVLSCPSCLSLVAYSSLSLDGHQAFLPSFPCCLVDTGLCASLYSSYHAETCTWTCTLCFAAGITCRH